MHVWPIYNWIDPGALVCLRRISGFGLLHINDEAVTFFFVAHEAGGGTMHGYKHFNLVSRFMLYIYIYIYIIIIVIYIYIRIYVHVLNLYECMTIFLRSFRKADTR